jgi:NitT/TauT family transport system substrate-binding protein
VERSVRRSAFVALALALWAAVPRKRALAQTAPPLKIGALPASVAAAAMYGVDMGFFKKNSLDVDVQYFNNGATITSAVLAGALDVGLVDIISVASAHVHGLPIVYLAPAMINSEKIPTYGIIVRNDSPIREPKDLSGKILAVNGLKNVSQIPIAAWIDNNGGDSTSVKWVEIGIPVMGATLERGTVDAISPNEPFFSEALKSGANRPIFMSHNAVAPAYLLSGWIASSDWIAKNPDAARHFAAAIREINDWTNKNPGPAAVILSKYTKVPVADIEHMHRGAFPTTFDLGLVQPVIDAAAKYGVIPKTFPAGDIVYKG